MSLGEINTKIKTDYNLTIFKANGKITFEEITSTIVKYMGGTVTKYIIWDFMDCTIPFLSTDKIHELIEFLKKYTLQRGEGLTALVFSRDVHFGLGRMVETYLQIEKYSIPIKCFRDIESAYDWFGIEPTELS